MIDIFLSLVMLGVVAFYYFRTWQHIAKHPKIPVIPRWSPPIGLSPADVYFIDNTRVSKDIRPAISASLLQLAVKGYLTLDQNPQALVINRTSKSIIEESVHESENVILKWIERHHHSFEISRANRASLTLLEWSFLMALSKEHEIKYHKLQTWSIVKGLLLSIAAFALAILLTDMKFNDVVFVVVLVPALHIMGDFCLAGVSSLQKGEKSPDKKTSIYMTFLCFAVFFIAFLFLSWLQLKDFDIQKTVGFLGVVGLVIINIAAFYFLRAPTVLGAQMAAEINGLKLYLGLAEKDRINLTGNPDISPLHFETLLPYAVALGMEKPWAHVFENRFDSAFNDNGQNKYDPEWINKSFFHNQGSVSGDLLATIDVMTADLPKLQQTIHSLFLKKDS